MSVWKAAKRDIVYLDPGAVIIMDGIEHFAGYDVVGLHARISTPIVTRAGNEGVTQSGQKYVIRDQQDVLNDECCWLIRKAAIAWKVNDWHFLKTLTK